MQAFEASFSPSPSLPSAPPLRTCLGSKMDSGSGGVKDLYHTFFHAFSKVTR